MPLPSPGRRLPGPSGLLLIVYEPTKSAFSWWTAASGVLAARAPLLVNGTDPLAGTGVNLGHHGATVGARVRFHLVTPGRRWVAVLGWCARRVPRRAGRGS